MPTIRRALIGVGAGLASAAVLASATPAFAADFVNTKDSNITTAIQGSTTILNWTVRNEGAPVYSQVGGVVTLTAPTGTSFPDQQSVPSTRSSDGVTFGATNLELGNCRTGSGGQQLTCTIGAADGQEASNWESGAYRRFEPTVNVNSDAPLGRIAGTAAMSFNNNRPGTETGLRVLEHEALEAVVLPSVPAPIVDPRIALVGALALLAGTFFGRRVVLGRSRARV